MVNNTLEDIKKPNLFIIGFPKCGTTSISRFLMQHPQVFYAKCSQEPAFWHDDFSSYYRKYSELEKYLTECYKGSENFNIISESTPMYIYSNTAIDNILEFNPDSKFIVLLRPVAELLYSLHGLNLYYGIEKEHDFKKAWSRPLINECKKDKNFILNYKEMGMLGKYVTMLEKKVHPKKILYIQLDEIKKDPRSVTNDILKFLNITNHEDVQIPRANERRSWKYKWLKHIAPRVIYLKKKLRINKKFGILNKIETQGEKINMEKELVAEINEYFSEDSETLLSLTK